MAIRKKVLVLVYWNAPKEQKTLVLILRRHPTGEEKLWQPITGNVDGVESYREAAIREVKEETGFSFPENLQDMNMEYQFCGRWGEVKERVFTLAVDGEKPPVPKLDRKEHCEYAWKEPIELPSLFPFPKQKEAVFRAFYRSHPFFLSKDGIWFQEGEEISHQRTSDLLHHSLVKVENEFCIQIGDSSVSAIIESTPLHISNVDLNKEKLLLVPHGDRQFSLDPTTLSMDADHVIYCDINGMKAKFSRKAYYELCKRVKEKKLEDSRVEYFLYWGGKDYPIPITN